VDQMAVLANTDVFLTHCGMNSISESLYMGVPVVMYPQTGEQKAVARRTFEMGAGVYLKEESKEEIQKALRIILEDSSYKDNAMKMRHDFRNCSGAAGAADFIEKVIFG
ncbi:MAG: glycosyltransferase, partial [Lachnospiraceae bacterium]|nr:glycosyltransferase [Lachnospiraceae bacterium]